MKLGFILVFTLLGHLLMAQSDTENLLKTYLETLASDEMKGRKIGTPENDSAAAYIAKVFAQNKLDFCVGKSYLVPFQLQGQTFYNVCAVRKSKSDYTIGFGAHFDHIGLASEGKDVIYNGADDDASGVAMVLTLSQLLNKPNTDANLVFMTFNGEEIGLKGSKGLTDNPEFKEKWLSKMKILFNLEMLGTVAAEGKGKVFMTGDNLSDLDELINENASKNFKIVPDPYKAENLFYRSDNVNFYNNGVVAHSFSTVDMDNQTHYHRVNDDISVIDFQNLAEITNGFAVVIEKLIKNKTVPVYNFSK